jgi:hypothetical protein
MFFVPRREAAVRFSQIAVAAMKSITETIVIRRMILLIRAAFPRADKSGQLAQIAPALFKTASNLKTKPQAHQLQHQ